MADIVHRYFIQGVKSEKITTGVFNIHSLLKLADFYEKNKEKILKFMTCLIHR